MSSARPCLACGARAPGPSIDKDGYRYATCASCGLASLDPLPAQADATELYDRGYFEAGAHAGYERYEKDERLHRHNARRRLRIIERAGGPRAGRIVDVGCAVGFLLDEAQRRGWEGGGVDVSKWAAERAHERFGLEVVSTLAEQAAAHPHEADVVTFFQVLEHMVDPYTVLEQARAALKPRGIVIIETWDRASLIARAFGSQWHQLSPPSVVHLFDRTSIRMMLERAGFAAKSITTTGKLVSAGAVAGLLRSKYPRLLGPLRRLSEIDLPIEYSFGDLITVSAVPFES